MNNPLNISKRVLENMKTKMKSIALLMGVGCLLCWSWTSHAATQGEDKSENPACIPRERVETRGSCQGLQNLASLGNIDILFLGDSITNFWTFPENGNVPGGLEIWNKIYKPLKAQNFGVSGDLTQDLLYRITDGRELEGFSPKVIVLLIGVNNTNNNETPANQIADGILKIVATIRERQPESKILLLGLFPRGGKVYMDRIIDINKLISKSADNQHVFFLDIGQQLLAPDPEMKTKEIFRDGLHLTPKGYQIWADAMNPKLFDLLNSAEK